MTKEEIQIIDELQNNGLGYKKIASLTGLPVNGVKSYCRRHKVDTSSVNKPQYYCRGCGRPIELMPKAKPRQFCSDKCRMRFWNSHRDEVKHYTLYTFQCPNCGKEFTSYGNRHRRYCSRVCAANARRIVGDTNG